MKKELYYKKEDALAAARNFAAECNGVTVNASADDRMNFDYKDRDAQDLCWSGETEAVLVSGQIDGKEVAGLFAWHSENDKAIDDLASSLIGALFTTDGDPYLIEDIETAEDAARLIAGKQADEILDCDDEWEDCLAKLDLTEENEPKRVYIVRDADGRQMARYCLADDWKLR